MAVQDINYYHLIFDLPEDVTAPDYYQLLGLKQFESDPKTIKFALMDRNALLQRMQNTENYDAVKRLEREIGRAHVCLTNPQSKSDYDHRLGDTVAHDGIPMVDQVVILPENVEQSEQIGAPKDISSGQFPKQQAETKSFADDNTEEKEFKPRGLQNQTAEIDDILTQNVNIYHRLLDLPEYVTAPNYYTLLGLTPLESDPEKIRNAALDRIAMLEQISNSENDEDVTRLLQEVDEATACLTSPQTKAEYDHKLSETIARRQTPARFRLQINPTFAKGVGLGFGVSALLFSMLIFSFWPSSAVTKPVDREEIAPPVRGGRPRLPVLGEGISQEPLSGKDFWPPVSPKSPEE